MWCRRFKKTNCVRMRASGNRLLILTNSQKIAYLATAERVLMMSIQSQLCLLRSSNLEGTTSAKSFQRVTIVSSSGIVIRGIYLGIMLLCLERGRPIKPVSCIHASQHLGLIRNLNWHISLQASFIAAIKRTTLHIASL